jgi:tetratricopeptide (TPR) repeat protein
MFLGSRGRFDEALAEMQRARELDPLSIVVQAGTGRILHFARRYDEALAIQRQALRMDPGFVSIRFDIGMTLIALGRYAEAEHEFSLAADATGIGTPAILVRAVVAHLEGRSAEALALYRELQDRQRSEGASLDELAFLAAMLGDLDAAYEWLKLACETHASMLAYVNVEPSLAVLREEPRCRGLLQSYGLVPPDAEKAG